jgi:hypothetical protein
MAASGVLRRLWGVDPQIFWFVAISRHFREIQVATDHQRILILCKTYPSPSARYVETSCVRIPVIAASDSMLIAATIPR